MKKEKILLQIRSLVQWALLAGLLLGLALPLTLLGLTIKSAAVITAGFTSFVLGFVVLMIMTKAGKEVSRLVKEINE